MECLVHGEGLDVGGELHGKEEARGGARKGPLRLDGPGEWRPPASSRSEAPPSLQWAVPPDESLRKLETAAYPAALPAHLRTVSSWSPALRPDPDL